MGRQTIIYIEDVVGGLFPSEIVYPSDNTIPNFGDLIIGEASGSDYIGISSGTLNLEETLIDNEVIFGKCFSNKFELQLYNCKFDLCNKKITVVQRDTTGASAETPIFSGIIESSTRDTTGIYRNIVAYDNYYFKKDIDVASWWNNLYTTSGAKYTVKYLREHLLQYVEIPYEDVTLVNDNIQIDGSAKFDNVSFDTLFTMLCEFSCCLPNINRIGTMQFIKYSAYQEPQSLDSAYQHSSSSTFEDFETNKITGIQLYDSSDSVAQKYGTDDNTYNIAGNILMLNLDAATIDIVLTNIYNTIKDWKYTPCSIALKESLFYVKLGEQFSTSLGNHYIMRNIFSGVQLYNQRIECVAENLDLNNTPSFDNDYMIMSGKIASINHDIDSFKVEYGNYKDEVNTRFSQTADSITAQVSAGVSTAENYTDGKLSLYVQKTDKGQVVSMLTGYADEIKFTATSKLTFEGATVKISGNKFSLTSDNTTIAEDGTITLKKGSINIANKFTVSEAGAVDCSNITVTGGSLNINNNFKVDTSGNCIANSFSSSSATITGGSISIDADSSTDNRISLRYNVSEGVYRQTNEMTISPLGFRFYHLFPSVSVQTEFVYNDSGLTLTGGGTLNFVTGTITQPLIVTASNDKKCRLGDGIWTSGNIYTTSNISCDGDISGAGLTISGGTNLNNCFVSGKLQIKGFVSGATGIPVICNDDHEIWLAWKDTGDLILWIDNNEMGKIKYE